MCHSGFTITHANFNNEHIESIRSSDIPDVVSVMTTLPYSLSIYRSSSCYSTSIVCPRCLWRSATVSIKEGRRRGIGICSSWTRSWWRRWTHRKDITAFMENLKELLPKHQHLFWYVYMCIYTSCIGRVSVCLICVVWTHYSVCVCVCVCVCV